MYIANNMFVIDANILCFNFVLEMEYPRSRMYKGRDPNTVQYCEMDSNCTKTTKCNRPTLNTGIMMSPDAKKLNESNVTY